MRINKENSHTWIAHVGTVILSTVFCLFLIETALRMFRPLYFSQPIEAYEYDKDLAYRLRAGIHSFFYRLSARISDQPNRHTKFSRRSVEIWGNGICARRFTYSRSRCAERLCLSFSTGFTSQPRQQGKIFQEIWGGKFGAWTLWRKAVCHHIKTICKTP